MPSHWYSPDALVCTPFLLGDGKQPGNHYQAVIQTAKYIHDVIEDRQDKKVVNPVILGLPVTRDRLSLYVFVLGTKKTSQGL